ncbi:efflux RND transporter permease subunit [Marinimicrobium agarilyticum]|uniref:efflux RND transporter permease subunit n=1 Tax=Marinimicrobium agarilyticum TaxID=306546 RepID=UPI0003FF1AB5|nr:MMPL family transporter [Marinimicrobium agarilyticum]
MLKMLDALYRATVLRHPAIALGVVLLLAVLAAAGLPNLKLDASADSLTLENDRSIDFFRKINQRYQSGDFLVVTYTPEAPMFSDESLETLKALHQDLSEVSGVANINSIIDVPLLYTPLRSLAEQQESTRTLLTEGVDRQAAKEEFLTSPIYRDTLLSPDGKTTALQLNLEVDNRYINLARKRDALREKAAEGELSPEEQQELEQVSQEFRAYRTKATTKSHQRVEDVRQILSKYEDKADLFLGGVSMITADMIAFIKSDLVVFGSAIVVFIIAMLALIFRQWRFVILPLSTCLLSVILMLGWLSWIDWRMTVISSNFVALLLIMTLALTIHLIVRFRELHAQQPEASKEELVLTTVRFMSRPCLYTALTTIVAFVSLVVSNIRPVIDFGWMMTIGLSVAFVLAFVVIPAGLMLWRKGEPKDKGDQSGAITLIFSRFAERHGAVVIGVALVAALVSAYGSSLLKVENKFIDYFHEDTEIYQGMSLIDKKLGGTISLDIIVTADPQEQTTNAEEDPFAEPGSAQEDPFATPESDDPFATDSGEESKPDSVWFTRAGLEQIQSLHQYLESLPEVGKVNSLAIAYEVASDINGGRLNNFELGVMRKSLPDNIREVLIKPYLSDEHRQTRITLRVQETSPELNRMALVEKIRDHAVNELDFEADNLQFTGMLVLYNNMLRSLFNSQIVTLGAVFVGIMLMFLVLFRSITIAIIAILPNMLAAGVVLGGMGLAGIPLDMMTITIAAITVGVGVDHAIHYLYRFRNEFADRGRYLESMHASHASIGRAMYYTAIIIIVGFSILALSEFIPSIYFGLLTALAMFAAILGSLTLLPKLVLLTKPFGKERD